ncbi:unnamed protein product, partial [Amoebophrya sp. A25]
FGNGSKGICLGTLCVMMQVLPSHMYASVAGLFMMLDAFSGITFGLGYRVWKSTFGGEVIGYYILMGVLLGCLGLAGGASFWILYEDGKRNADASKPPLKNSENKDEEKAPLLKLVVAEDDLSDETSPDEKNKTVEKMKAKEDKKKYFDAEASKKGSSSPASAEEEDLFPKDAMFLGVTCLCFVMFFGTCWGMVYNKKVKVDMFEASKRASHGLITRNTLKEILSDTQPRSLEEVQQGSDSDPILFSLLRGPTYQVGENYRMHA